MANTTNILPLSEEQLARLESYVDQYKSAKKKERKALTDAIASELGGTLPSIAPINLANVRKQIHEWFVDRLRKKKKQMVKYSAKWTAKMVFTREHSDEVEKRNIEVSGSAPGKGEYLVTLQTTIKQLWSEQTPEEQERMKEIAQRYNEGGMPRDVQLKHAEKYAGQVCSEFAHYMFRHFGARVWILGAMLDEDDDVAVEWHDYNPEISNRLTFTDFAPEWKDKPILPLFKEYAQAVFGKTGEEMPVKGKKKSKSEIKLDIDEDSLPLLPENMPSNRPDMEAVIRQFITGYYRYISQNEKSTVPWNAMSSNLGTFITAEYISDGVNLKDPSRVSLGDGQKLITLWKEREEKGLAPLDFTAYREKDGTIQAPKRSVAELFAQRPDRGGEKTRKKRTASNSELNIPTKRSKVGSRDNARAAEVNAGHEGRKSKGKTKDKKKKNSRTHRKRRSSKVDSDDEAKFTDGAESSDGDSTTESDSDEDEDDEDFTRAINSIRSDEEVSDLIKGKFAHPTEETQSSLNAPASVNHTNDEERLKFLNSLCYLKEYQDMVLAISEIDKKAGVPPKAFPPFGRWSYESHHLPSALHSNKAKAKKWLGWLRSQPYVTNSGELAGYGTIEGVALIVGMFLKDLCAMQFQAQDPDDAGGIDPVILTSSMEFAWTDEILLPVCKDVTEWVNLGVAAESLNSKAPERGDTTASRSATKVPSQSRGDGVTPRKKKKSDPNRSGKKDKHVAEKNTPKGTTKPTTPLADNLDGSPSRTQPRIQPKRTKKNQAWHKNADLM